MLRRMSSRELSEYLVFMGMEPIGEERADKRAAESTASIVNHLIGIWTKSKRYVKPEDVLSWTRKEDHVPDWIENDEPDEPEAVEARNRSIGDKIFGIFGKPKRKPS
jgi:hypothetical protein